MLFLGPGLALTSGPEPAAKAAPVELHPAVLLTPARAPQVEASEALLVDLRSQTVLYQKNADRPVAPASTTKMMTALVAIEYGSLSDTVVIQPADLREGTGVGLAPGEQWTLKDLLYDLLLSSDNTAAVAIARHVGGSEQAFVALMNQQAADWGLSETHFVNPHGLDEPGHYSSARDLAQIALHGLNDPTFAQIVGTREYRVGPHTLVNLNQLLGAYPGIEGVKTGTTEAAGQCLVAAAERPTGNVLCVVLGSTDRYADAQALLDYYYTSYHTFTLSLGSTEVSVLLPADLPPHQL